MHNRLRALQLKKLRQTIAYVSEHVPFYRRTLAAAGIRAADIRSLDDLRKLPITERSDFEGGSSDFISRAPGLTASVILPSTGTSGQPLDAFLTSGELDYYTSLQAIAGMTWNFLGPAHIVQVHLPYDISVSAKILTTAAHKTGALVLNLGLTGELDKHLDSLLQKRDVPGKFPQVSTLFAAPGYLWALAARALQRGLKPEQFGLKSVSTGGAKVSADLKKLVRQAWGQTLRQGYSLAETVSTGAYSCDHDRLHFLDFSGIMEVLDPVTRQPVPPGQPGVAVFTTFYPDRELMPLLRYWTRDLVQPIPEKFCPCGQATTAIAEIIGRTDHMMTVGGQNFYPQPVGDALTGFAELVQPPRFEFRSEFRSDREYAVLHVEAVQARDESARQALVGKIFQAVPIFRADHLAGGFVGHEINIVPAGSLAAPFRYKLQGPTPV